MAATVQDWLAAWLTPTTSLPHSAATSVVSVPPLTVLSVAPSLATAELDELRDRHWPLPLPVYPSPLLSVDHLGPVAFRRMRSTVLGGWAIAALIDRNTIRSASDASRSRRFSACTRLEAHAELGPGPVRRERAVLDCVNPVRLRPLGRLSVETECGDGSNGWTVPLAPRG